MERQVWKNLDINIGIKAGQLIFFFLFFLFYQLGPDGLSLRSSHWSSVRILFLLIQAWHEQIPFSFIRASIWRQGRCHSASVALFSDRDGHVTKKKDCGACRPWTQVTFFFTFLLTVICKNTSDHLSSWEANFLPIKCCCSHNRCKQHVLIYWFSFS